MKYLAYIIPGILINILGYSSLFFGVFHKHRINIVFGALLAQIILYFGFSI